MRVDPARPVAREQFGSRLGMMLAMLGMAVGTGNIWRFPRIAAKNGGGEFLVPWIVFLFLWSIPLILLEFGLGRKLRCGPVRAFGRVLGPRWAWMGAFCVFVTAAIGFYYSVVAGWTFRFAFAAATGEIPEPQLGSFWGEYSGSSWPALTHALAIGAATFVVVRGVSSIERVAKVLMPVLVVLVLVLCLRAVTLPGAGAGLDYLFSVDWSALGRAELWLEALSQNAWDTGAGWGLVLAYAVYLREGEDTTQNAFLLPIANNAISLIAGITVLCTVFSVVPALAANLASQPDALAAYPALADALRAGQQVSPEVLRETIFEQGNEGLTFVWMPQLFAGLPAGRLFMFLFFAALSVAAVTSLISMVEVGARALMDGGVERGRAVKLVGGLAFMLGLPSVLWMDFLRNQDWVWGVALMIAGLFFAIVAIVLGPRRFREEHLNHPGSRWRVGRWWDLTISVLVPIQAVVLLGWWLWQAAGWDADWMDPFGVTNVGTVLFQVALVCVVLMLANRWIARRSLAGEGDES